jgi:hypothetical protein
MQLTLLDDREVRPARIPTIVLRKVSADYIGARFRQIGPPSRFNTILSRFRYDFPLATCQELEGQAWWVIASSQRQVVEEFAKRNGLQLLDE